VHARRSHGDTATPAFRGRTTHGKSRCGPKLRAWRDGATCVPKNACVTASACETTRKGQLTRRATRRAASILTGAYRDELREQPASGVTTARNERLEAIASPGSRTCVETRVMEQHGSAYDAKSAAGFKSHADHEIASRTLFVLEHVRTTRHEVRALRIGGTMSSTRLTSRDRSFLHRNGAGATLIGAIRRDVPLLVAWQFHRLRLALCRCSAVARHIRRT
jgi:hypothetical protein